MKRVMKCVVNILLACFGTPKQSFSRTFRHLATPFGNPENGLILSQFYQVRSVLLAQRWTRQAMQKFALHRSESAGWKQKFLEAEILGHRGKSKRPSTGQQAIRQVSELSRTSSPFSIRAASR